MKKTLENQLTMCNMIPDDQYQTNTNQDDRRSCNTNNICGVSDEQKNDLCSFVQWQKHNKELLSQSIEGHHQSNVVEYNVQRAINTLSGSVDKCMQDSRNKIASTTRNIDKWKTSIYQALESIRKEIDLLLLNKKKMQKAQTALGIICSISTECLERRSFRLNMDLTLDPGQVELNKEKELINEIGNLFCQTLHQINDQLNRNNHIKYQLEENWSNKNQSFKIDVLNLGLNIQSPAIMSHTDVVKNSENTCLSIPEWEESTNGLYKEAIQIINESTLLRNVINNLVLKKSAKQLRDQADAVDIALARFIADTQQVEKAIENDLIQIVQRLGDSEKLIGDLLRVITNLEKAKKTAETRLYNRLKRPGDENCQDTAQLNLISEVQNLQEQLNTLNYQLHCARTGHLGLQDSRSKLEDEARIKRKSLWIDIIRCQNVRAHYPSQNTLIGH